MKKEINSAVHFVSGILKGRIDDPQVDTFRQTLEVIMCTHYQNHWFPEKPFKGSGYRCLRINHKMDPLISKAGKDCGLSEETLFKIFPNEFTLWVDPDEVSYRIGEDGSIGVLLGEGESQEEDSQQDNSQDNCLILSMKDNLCSYDYYMPEQTTDNHQVGNMEYLTTRVAS